MNFSTAGSVDPIACLIASLKAASNLASTFALVAASVMLLGTKRIALGAGGVIGNVQIGPGSSAGSRWKYLFVFESARCQPSYDVR